MTRILLICPEPIGRGNPAGVGIRYLEFARSLAGTGHPVTLLTPDAAEVEGCSSGSTSPASIAEATTRTDVAVVQGHAVNDFLAHGTRIPLVVDLYDPYIVENFNYWSEHGDQVFDHDHATLIRSLENGDFFLCASSAQRLFYIGMLIALRRIDAKLYHDDHSLRSFIDLVPFGVPPVPPLERRDGAPPRLLFGGIYDWYDPVLAVDAVILARRTVPGLTLTFTHHPNAGTTPQGKTAATIKHVRQTRSSDFIEFRPWVPYGSRLAFYREFAGALLTFPTSLETELAMRTRIFDYLWGELPVISSPAPGTDEVLRRYGAGHVVEAPSAVDFADAIVRMFLDEGHRESCVIGARAFAADHQWERLIEPLLRFCSNPVTTPKQPPRELPPPRRDPLRTRLMRRLRRMV